ncbi:MAG TPA: CCA tRNA nucleotidyltransferase [Gemmatimonadales bacterium]|nr:CCA tRNA nucleotidyltransferase [Gemmatimonadales bacterium]
MSGAAIAPVMPLPEPVLEIARTLEEAGFDTWCVGGAVRDWRLGLTDQDVDLATAATPEQVQALFPRTVAVGVKYGTVGVLDRNRRLHEVTTFRRDVSTDGRHAVVEYGVSIDEDLARRDFTINALAWHPLRRELRDPYAGARDIEAGLVRAVGRPAVRFAEDHLRILRMLRFAARFGFAIDPATWDAARSAARELTGLSAERVRDEWFKGLQSARSIAALVRAWREVGAAAVWIPELEEAPRVVEPVPTLDPVVLTFALCRAAPEVLFRLKASNAEIARARAMERGPAEPASRDPVVVRRWLAQVGDAANDFIALAGVRAGKAPAWREVVEQSRVRGEATSRGQLALTGADLRDAGVPAGPEMGRLLEKLLDAVLEDPARNTRESLLALVRAWR